MNPSRKILFSSLLSKHMENFSSYFNIIFQDIERAVQAGKKIDFIFTTLFPKFPRIDLHYQLMLSDLTELALLDIESILSFFPKAYKDVINQKKNVFSVLQELCPSFDNSNRGHFLLFYYLSLFILNDILTSIVFKNNDVSSQVATMIARTGHSVVYSKPLLDYLHLIVVKQWSVIISKLSKRNHSEVSDLFSSFPLNSDLVYPTLLMRFVRYDVEEAVGPFYIDNLIQFCKQQAKKKALSSSVLESIASMLTTLPENDDMYQKLYNFVHSLRHEKSLWRGYMILMTCLYLKYSKIQNKTQVFFNKKVLKQAGNKKKVETAITCFQIAMGGINIKTKYLLYEWCLNPHATPLSFIRYLNNNNPTQFLNINVGISFLPFYPLPSFSFLNTNAHSSTRSASTSNLSNLQNQTSSPSSPRSHSSKLTGAQVFPNVFMNIFFVKSDFSVCPDFFKKTLVHIASIDFLNYMTIISPQFLHLPFKDPRFLVFLLTIAEINTDEFLKNCYSKATKDDIKEFNVVCYPRIHEAILSQDLSENDYESTFDNFTDICPSPRFTSGQNLNTSPESSSYSSSSNETSKNKSSNKNNYPKHGVCIREFSFLLKNLSDESDLKVAEILEEWKIKRFKMIELKHIRSQPTLETLNLKLNLLNIMQYVLTQKDFEDRNIASFILELSCNIENRIAVAAYDLCTNFIATHVDLNKFLTYALEHQCAFADQESVFVIFSLVYNIMKKSYGKVEIDHNLLRKIESKSFILLTSMFPTTRSLGSGLLYECSKRIKNKSLISFVKPRLSYLEETVKNKILLFSISEKAEMKLPPVSTISFRISLMSHFYDIWLFFLAELINILIASNFTPFLEFVDSDREKVLSMLSETTSEFEYTGLFLMFLSTQFHLPTLVLSSYIDFSNMYEDFDSSKMQEDKRQDVCNIIHALLSSKDKVLNETAFHLIIHLNFSLQPMMIDVLSLVQPSLFGKAILTVSVLLRMPELDSSFYTHNIQRIVKFIMSVQFYFKENGLNSSRLVKWKLNDENKLISHIDLMINFCIIIITLLTQNCLPNNGMHNDNSEASLHLKNESNEFNFNIINESLFKVSEEDWPINSRQLIIVFLVNWSTTTLPSLKGLRIFSSLAMGILMGVGPCFNDPISFDFNMFHLFANIELNGFPVLYNLLRHHIELILVHFINACYLLPRFLADLFFDSILTLIITEKPFFVYLMAGQIIFLSCVYSYKDHPKSTAMIQGLLNIKEISSLSNVAYDRDPNEIFHYDNLPIIFSFAVEAVFDAFFNVMKLNDRHISSNDIIESVKPWIKLIRLLPKQQTCNSSVPKEFNYFTPYEFLEKLAEITKNVEDEQYRAIVSLWTELGELPDHNDLVPQYLNNWEELESKKRIFEVLIETDSLDLTFRIAKRCTFPFYFHQNSYLNPKFNISILDEYKWLVMLLSNAFHRNWAKMIPLLPQLVHFVFISSIGGNRQLFDVICRNLKIEFYEGIFTPKTLRKVVEQIVQKIDENSVMEWGNEALKWVFGCKSLDFVTISLLVYNVIMKPFDSQIPYYIIRCVSYHVENNAESTFLNFFLSEIIQFFKNLSTLKDNPYESIIIKFLSSFFDCRQFMEIFAETLDIFIPSIISKTIEDKQMIVSIFRPKFSSLHRDEQAKTYLDEVIELTKDEELKMIALPFKMLSPNRFKSLSEYTIDQIIEQCSFSTLCKSIVHYILMFENSDFFVHDRIFVIAEKIINILPLKYLAIVMNSLAKLYQVASLSISRCQNSINLIGAICAKIPDVALINVVGIYEWDRSIEDVSRALKQLVKEIEPQLNYSSSNQTKTGNSNNLVIITDCSSYKQIVNFLFSESIPKILPYAAHAEVIESMKHVKRNKIRAPFSYEKRKRKISSISTIPSSLSIIFTGENDDKTSEMKKWKPLPHPQSLILDNINKKNSNPSRRPSHLSIIKFLQSGS